MKRASPSEQRRALEIANLFVRVGIPFVCMPCADEAERQARADEAIKRLDEIERAADTQEGAK